jgi:glycosyltransferase involved in cell wall biosynthesis
VHLDLFVAHDWPAAPGPGRPLRVLFVGRLVPPKALELLLQALLDVRTKGWDVVLDVVGDGAMEATWRALTDQLELASVVHFHGALPAAQVAAQMALCHVFCLPSVRESGGAVLLEAMASARPVIALDYGGPAEIVNDEVGALLAFTSPQQVIDDLAATLIDIFRHPESWRERGLTGRRVAEKLYSWPAKIASAAPIYRNLLSSKAVDA